MLEAMIMQIVESMYIFVLSGFFFATSVGDILKIDIALYTCTLSWRLQEVYQREPPDHIILTAKLDGKLYWEKTVTEFNIEEMLLKVTPGVFYVTLTIFHNKGIASTEDEKLEVRGTCVFVHVHVHVDYSAVCVGRYT